MSGSVAGPLGMYLSWTFEAKNMCTALEDFVLSIVYSSSTYALCLLDALLVWLKTAVFFLLLHCMWYIAKNTQWSFSLCLQLIASVLNMKDGFYLRLVEASVHWFFSDIFILFYFIKLFWWLVLEMWSVILCRLSFNFFLAVNVLVIFNNLIRFMLCCILCCWLLIASVDIIYAVPNLFSVDDSLMSISSKGSYFFFSQ